MLSIEHLGKVYKTKKNTYRALEDVNISFPDVGFAAILGPSGCGKTTFLNLLGGLDKVKEGDIFFQGESLKGMSDEKLNSYRNNYIGFVFQDYFLLPQMNVLENVRLGLLLRGEKDKESLEKAFNMLERMKIEDLAYKKVNELSGGQMQRVSIARALVTDPKIILADEPTGALDSKTSEEIMALLKEFSSDHLVILVTHNEEQALKYASRIIRFKDGKVISDTLPCGCGEKEEVFFKKSKLPFLTSLKLAFKNVLTKKTKTVMSVVASSFGMLGLGFYLALNTGFDDYATQVNKITASSLPVILTSYTLEEEENDFSDVNVSIEYTEADEIYPSLPVKTNTSYRFNQFTDKYFRFLDSLVDDGLAIDYVVNYGNDYNLNLTTVFPESADGTKEGYIGAVDTTLISANSIAQTGRLPTNVFHSLYGDLDDYDLLAGKLPEEETELVLVVDKYNAVDFSILKDLGFYNASDSEDDVKDDRNKVKPISFDNVLGKEYKIFSNDEYYALKEKTTKKDSLSNQRTVTTYEENDLHELYSKAGKKLKISGIIRAKENSDYALLSPSLCYLPSLQGEYVKENVNSKLSADLKGNVLFNLKDGQLLSDFKSEIKEVCKPYLNGEIDILPTSEINRLLDEYFIYFDFLTKAELPLSSLVKEAGVLGLDLVDDKMKGLTLSDSEEAVSLVEECINSLSRGQVDEFYSYAISLSAFSNAYSLIQYVTIIPTDLNNRNEIINRLDQYNEIKSGSENNAASEKEQVFYSSLNSSTAIKQISSLVSLASLILMIYAIVSLFIACLLTSIMTTNGVLERRKEIGLLRALGTRKKDIMLTFELESLIIGLLTGVFGSLLTYAVSFPINAVIYNSFPYYEAFSMAQFTFTHSLIILSVSLVVAFLSSLIPSLSASKQNPVNCLRSE